MAEGRDIALVVAPDAAVKVYLFADPAERARRHAVAAGDLQARDERDQTEGAACSSRRPTRCRSTRPR